MCNPGDHPQGPPLNQPQLYEHTCVSYDQDGIRILHIHFICSFLLFNFLYFFTRMSNMDHPETWRLTTSPQNQLPFDENTCVVNDQDGVRMV
jgi:hypothetical protein